MTTLLQYFSTRPARALGSFAATFACLAVSAVLSAPAVAQVVSVNGKIAFTVNSGAPDFTNDIWVMNPDGTDQVNLTNSPTVSESNPVWSPDGTKIAFVQGDSIFSSIWVMNADGSGQTKVSTFTGIEFGPTWSSDGARIACVRQVPGNSISIQFDIFVLNVDGSGESNITNSDYDELEPAWSPDGSKIAFAGVRFNGTFNDWEIVTVNPDGTGETDLILADQSNRSPAWSPDSSRITFMSQFDNPCCEVWQIWAMNRDGSGQTNLSNDPTVNDMFPSWSPDGTLITFSSTRNACCGQTNIFSMPAPASLPVAAAAQATQAAAAQATQLTTNGAASDPDWGRGAAAVCSSNCLRSAQIGLAAVVNGNIVGVLGRVLVRNEMRAAVHRARVTVKWTRPNGVTQTASASTDANGAADLVIIGGHGTWTLTVTNIAKPGFTFDPAKSVLSKSITK